MFWYLFSCFIALGVWYLIQWFLALRTHFQILKKVPLHEEMNSMFSMKFFSKVKSATGFLNAIQTWIFGTGVQMYAYWVLSMPLPVYVLVKPGVLKEMLKLPVTTRKGRAFEKLRPWLGDGLALTSGQRWERNRRLLTPAFHFDILKSYAVVFNREATVWLDIVAESSKDGHSVNIEPLIKCATLDTMLRCALSYGEDGEVQRLGEKHPYLEAIKIISKSFEGRLLNPLFMFSDWLWYLFGDGKEFLRNVDFVHDFASKIIASRRKALEGESGVPGSGKRRLDFLDILLQARDSDGKGLSDEEIRWEVDTFMFAGHDTTGSALTWAANSLAKYPEEQDKVVEELEAVLGDRTELEWKDLSELRYLTCFIKEVLRLYTPAVTLSRTLAEPWTVNGVQLPKGTHVDGYIHTLHHHPDVWEEPEEFRPSRFLPENQSKMDPYAFLPFSAGPRNCIGQVFAMNELKIFLARLVQRFVVSVDPSRPAVPFHELVVTSENGVYLYFRERQTGRQQTTV